MCRRHFGRVLIGDPDLRGVSIAVCLLATAWCFPGLAAEHQPSKQGNRFLFIVSTSSAMSRSRDATARQLAGFVGNGLEGWLKAGDTYGVWTYNGQIDTRFPMQTWNPGEAASLAEKTQQYLSGQACQGKEVPAAFMPALTRVIDSVKDVIVLIVNDGTQPLNGTPFDVEINKARAQVLPEMKQLRQPVITALLVRKGQIEKWGVNSPELRLPLPNPSALITMTPAKDESLPLKQNADGGAPNPASNTVTAAVSPAPAAGASNLPVRPKAALTNLAKVEPKAEPASSINPSAAPTQANTAPAASRAAIIMTRDTIPSKSWMDLPGQTQAVAQVPQAATNASAAGQASLLASNAAPTARASGTHEPSSATGLVNATTAPRSNAQAGNSISMGPLLAPDDLLPATDGAASSAATASGSFPRNEGAASAIPQPDRSSSPLMETAPSFNVTPDFGPREDRDHSQAAALHLALLACGFLSGALLAGAMVWRWQQSRRRTSLITQGYGRVRHQQAASSSTRSTTEPVNSDPGVPHSSPGSLETSVDRHHAPQQA
jgi:hypothetical protein